MGACYGCRGTVASLCWHNTAPVCALKHGAALVGWERRLKLDMSGGDLCSWCGVGQLDVYSVPLTNFFDDCTASPW